MNKLSKTQRERIGIVAVCVPLLMGLLYYFCVTAQQAQVAKIRDSSKVMDDKLRKAESIMSQGERISDELDARQEVLKKREAMMSPDRDAYAWIIETINPFVQLHKGVNIYSYSQPYVDEAGILPNFPYRWATFHLKATGYFYEFGRFLADFENSFPYFRVQNLQIAPNTGPAVSPEQLSYTFDLVCPVVATSP